MIDTCLNIRSKESVAICSISLGETLFTKDRLPYIVRRIFSNYNFEVLMESGDPMQFEGYFVSSKFVLLSGLNDTKEVAFTTSTIKFVNTESLEPENAKLFVIVQFITVDTKITYGCSGLGE